MPEKAEMDEQQTLGIDEIDRKYEVLEKLGEGGMGAIYKVRHKLLDELRVIKMIRSELKEKDDLQARFLREARVATQLRHSNIAQMFDFSIGEDGTAYIVMEFIDGRNLHELLDVGGPLPLGTAVGVAEQCLDALAYLHEKQFIHRDISPDNVMLVQDASGRADVKLIDLGIAKDLESTQSHTRTGLFVGKVKYASPEALSGSAELQVEARSDLYSLGMVLYESLTGEFAVTGTDNMSIIAGHLFHPPRSFEETDPGDRIPPELRAVVLKALEKAPDDRFATAGEFRQALRRAGAADLGLDEEEEHTISIDRALMEAPVPEGAAMPTELVDAAGGPAEGGGTASWVRARGRYAALGAVGLALAGVVGWWVATGGLAALSGGSAVAGGERSGSSETGSVGGAQAAAALAQLDYGNYHALVIGNNSYEQLPRLETAAVDAQEFARVLEEKYRFNVTLLTDATRYDTIRALTETADSLTARDNLLIYYAGHGWLDAQNESGYWQPIDAEPFNTANWISTKYEVSAVLGRVPAQQVLVVADSCYSGAISEPVSLEAPPDRGGADYANHVRDLLTRRSRLALTSGGLSPVLDVGDGRHSVFSKVLLEVLDANNGVIETSRIFTEIRERVSQAAARFGAEQDPQLSPIPQAGDEGGDFFFVPAAG